MVEQVMVLWVTPDNVQHTLHNRNVQGWRCVQFVRYVEDGRTFYDMLFEREA